MMGSNQLHFGANFQHREFQSNNAAIVSPTQGSPSTNQLARYRARPFSQLTDVRFVDTGNFAAKSDNIIGLEAAGIFKSLHVAAEGQILKAKAYRAGDSFDADDPLDFFPTATALVPGGNPSFWGGYIEAGYYLTGETRGYKTGTWDRTKVLKPFSKGGWGAFQVNGRIDYLDLADNDLKNGFTNNFTNRHVGRLGEPRPRRQADRLPRQHDLAPRGLDALLLPIFARSGHRRAAGRDGLPGQRRAARRA